MFKELSTDVENFVTPDHGCLTGWAEQGLLVFTSFLPISSLYTYIRRHSTL